MKIIVISLAVIILILFTIVIFALFSKFKLKSSIDSFPLERTLFKIDQKYDIITLDIEKDYLYLHLGTGQKNQILRIYNIKTGTLVRDFDLK